MGERASCGGLTEETAAEGIGVEVLSAADGDSELRVVLSEKDADEGVGVGITS